jgi:hypothetical protein
MILAVKDVQMGGCIIQGRHKNKRTKKGKIERAQK